METVTLGEARPGLPARADTETAPTRAAGASAAAQITITIELDRATARYLRHLARTERRTEAMQARYLLEKIVLDAYFAPAVRGNLTGGMR